MVSISELKEGMKVKLKPYHEDLQKIEHNPGITETMMPLMGTVVTIGHIRSNSSLLGIKEEPMYLWDVSWIDHIVEEQDCDDCKFNPNTADLNGVSARCWDCVSPCGEKRYFAPKDDTSQQDKLLTGSALDTQVGGSHYKDMKIQPFQYAIANKLNPCQTVALRYLSRKKGGKEKVLEDRRKAIHVIQIEIEAIEKGDIEIE